MATGITKREQHGANAKTAADHSVDPYPLPPSDCQASLIFPRKLDDATVLRPLGAQFANLGELGAVDSVSELEPNAFVLCNNFYGLNKAAETLSGRVKLIYTDPPYGTGFGFHSRELEHAYDDHIDGARYIEFMRRRLILCRELLSPDGSLYLHIGHQMLAEMKLVLDEIFGRNNFRNVIARRKCSSKNSTRRTFPNLLDFVLFYSRSPKYEFNQPCEQPSEEWLRREYPKVDSKGAYKLVPIHAPGTRAGASGSEWRGMMPPPGKHWQYAPSKLDLLDSEGEIHWSRTGNPRRKVYLDPNKGLPLTDYWANYRDAHHQSIAITGYPTEKNLEMVKQIVAAGSSPGDLVLDPFCGSGTTLQAADDQGRRWLGFDQSITAAEATLGRLRHGLSKMGDYRNPSLVESDLFGASPRKFSLIADQAMIEAYPDEVMRLARTTPAVP